MPAPADGAIAVTPDFTPAPLAAFLDVDPLLRLADLEQGDRDVKLDTMELALTWRMGGPRVQLHCTGCI